MKGKDIRWRQRLQNYQKSMDLLSSALIVESPDIVYKAGIVHFFEMSFELAWNLMKDFLESEGFDDVKSPRTAIKTAYEYGLIGEGHVWMELLTDRNLAAHTYDEAKSRELDALIRNKYYPVLLQLLNDFKDKSHES